MTNYVRALFFLVAILAMCMATYLLVVLPL